MPSLVEIERAIGLAATLKLVEHFGGTHIYPPCPEFLTNEHKLARAIGLDAARKLVQDYVGDRLCVPLAAKAKRLARYRALRHDGANMSGPQIARKYQMTERQVSTILRGSRLLKHRSNQSTSRREGSLSNNFKTARRP